MAHQIVMISGSMMPKHSNGRGLAKCQRQEDIMLQPLSQTRIWPNIVIINYLISIDINLNKLFVNIYCFIVLESLDSNSTGCPKKERFLLNALKLRSWPQQQVLIEILVLTNGAESTLTLQKSGRCPLFSRPPVARAGTNKLKCQKKSPNRLTLDPNLRQSGKFKQFFEP